MDKLRELSAKLEELSAKYADISQMGYDDLEAAWKEFDEVKKEAYDVSQQMLVGVTREQNGRFKANADIEIDIHEISEISTTVDKLTDRAYSEIHRIAMQRDSKKNRYFENGKRVIELRRNIRTNNARITQLEGEIKNIRRELGDPNLTEEMIADLAAQGITYTPSESNLSPERRYYLEQELAAKLASLDEYRRVNEEYQEEERSLVDEMEALKHGGMVEGFTNEMPQELAPGLDQERELTPEELEQDAERILINPTPGYTPTEQEVTQGEVEHPQNDSEELTDEEERILIDPTPGYTGEQSGNPAGQGEGSSDQTGEGSGEGSDDESGSGSEEEQEEEDLPEELTGGEDGETGEDESESQEEEEEQNIDNPVPGPGTGEGTGDGSEPGGESGDDESGTEEEQEEEEQEVPGELEPTEEEEIAQVPNVKGNKPKVTWKTVLATAAGIGIGAGVFFAAGPLGVGVMSLAGGIAKKFINKKRKELAQAQKLGGSMEVEEIREPKTGIKGAWSRFKNYLKSEEGLRDMNWMINAAIITGVGLSVASTVQNLVGQTQPVTPDPVTPEPTVPEPIVQEPDVLGFEDIKLGSEVDGFNVSTGHDSAGWAVNNINPETLASQYVNGDSIFHRFASINPDGTLGQIIDTRGLSLSEFCAQTGMDPSQIAVDVARADGASQAWISATELVSGIGGPTI